MKYLLVLLGLFIGGFATWSGIPPSGRAAEPGRASTRPPTVDPYKAGLAFARCMRQHGVPHPDPDRAGNFRLTPADEKRLQRISRATKDAADKACFRFLKPVTSTEPLSARAKKLARAALQTVRDCMRRHGYVFGRPIVENMSRGRAFFGFVDVSLATREAQGTPRYQSAQRMCERGLAAKLDKIIADDRGETGY
jgi:hypothetical protein